MRKEGIGGLVQRHFFLRIGVGVVIDEIFVEADLSQQANALGLLTFLSELGKVRHGNF